MRAMLTGVIVAVVALALPQMADAQKMTGPQLITAVRNQLATAISLAEQASRAPSVRTGHQLIQRAINCLQGPKGRMFKSADGNPCQGKGNGILPDLKGAATLGVQVPEEATRNANLALDVAVAAICMMGLMEVRADSLKVANQLKAVLTALSR